MREENTIWNGYNKMLISIGGNSEIDNIVNLGSILVEPQEGEIEFLHVIKLKYNGQLPKNWREDSHRVKECNNILQEKGYHSKDEIVTANSIKKGILEEAERINADVIVVGWGPKPLGSVSSLVSHLMRKAQSDVIVFKRRGNLRDIKNIVYPLAKKPSINRLRLIERFVKNTSANLTFLHVSEDSTESKKRGEMLLHQAIAEAYELGIEPVSQLVIGDNVFDTIIDISDKYDLMILGPSGGWWLKKTLFGNKTDKVAANSHCSVLLHKTAVD
ncbi:MAG: universal stress protein [Bacillota bacterium]